ncbi:MAG: response regulator [Rhodopirellula sp. JB055]|uniref:response regulator n=1 Tax=Rhodopirellula sp. JB055 TaxID=3342846 RepID=UPI00370A53DC
MLVVSRRKGECISFPQVGITIKFVRIHSATAKVGVDAPKNLQIIRGDSDSDPVSYEDWTQEALAVLPRETRHAIRNELHSISLGLHLLKHQIDLNLMDDAERTFETMQRALLSLNEQEVLKGNEGASRIDRRTILLVEDDANERELLASYLRLKGYNMVCVGDGEMALDYLSKHEAPRFILLDMKMPERDGASTLQEIRSDERFNDIMVFAISGSTAEENGLADNDEQIERWFMKPLCVDNLVSALKLVV